MLGSKRRPFKKAKLKGLAFLQLQPLSYPTPHLDEQELAVPVLLELRKQQSRAAY